MKRVTFVCFVAFCIASVENLKNKQESTCTEVNADMHAFIGECEDAVSKGWSSPVQEMSVAMCEENATKKHSESEENESIGPLPDIERDGPITVFATLSRAGSVLNMESNFTDDEVVHKLVEILDNLHEIFDNIWAKCKKAESCISKLSTSIEQLNSYRSEEAKMQKKDKKHKKEIQQIECVCSNMVHESKKILNEIETKMRELKDKISLGTNRCKTTVLVFRAEYALMKRKLDILNRNHDKIKNILHEAFANSREVELQKNFKRKTMFDKNPLQTRLDN